MGAYLLREVDDEFWAKVKARAASEGRGLKGAILYVLAIYAKVGMAGLERRAKRSEVRESERGAA